VLPALSVAFKFAALISVASVAKALGVGRTTLYAHLPEARRRAQEDAWVPCSVETLYVLAKIERGRN
jgi:DNA invertase Pin-like site-specific DNA recombinase